VRYAFVAEHRPVFPVRAMCRCLRIHPSGFYAWLRNPLSKRAQEDARQTELIRKAWKESGKVYGYRKLHDDLLDQGETCCPNRVARLARQADIKAQIGYRRRPGVYGGKPSVVVDNTLDRQFDVEDPDKVWVTDITYIRTLEGFAYPTTRAASCRRLFNPAKDILAVGVKTALLRGTRSDRDSSFVLIAPDKTHRRTRAHVKMRRCLTARHAGSNFPHKPNTQI
jgi:transposase InsO family protein